jgi:hypothetical protein
MASYRTRLRAKQRIADLEAQLAAAAAAAPPPIPPSANPVATHGYRPPADPLLAHLRGQLAQERAANLTQWRQIMRLRAEHDALMNRLERVLLRSSLPWMSLPDVVWCIEDSLCRDTQMTKLRRVALAETLPATSCALRDLIDDLFPGRLDDAE